MEKFDFNTEQPTETVSHWREKLEQEKRKKYFAKVSAFFEDEYRSSIFNIAASIAVIMVAFSMMPVLPELLENEFVSMENVSPWVLESHVFTTLYASSYLVFNALLTLFICVSLIYALIAGFVVGGVVYALFIGWFGGIIETFLLSHVWLQDALIFLPYPILIGIIVINFIRLKKACRFKRGEYLEYL